MKYLFTLLVFFSISTISFAQENDDSSSRNGDFLIELGNGIFGNFASSGSGASVIFGDGITVSSIGLNAGKFISDNFALKTNIGLLNINTDFGGNNTFLITGGGKYYFGGRVPLEVSAGVVTGQDLTTFISNATLGYGIPLAHNINLEPGVSLFLADSNVDVGLQLTFALFL